MALNVYLLICFLVVDMAQDYFLNKTFPGVKIKYQHSLVSPRRPLHEHKASKSPNDDDSNFYTSPLLVQAISRNQLLYFLLGNVFTGVVNLSVRTILMSDISAMGILILYLLIVNGLIVLLHVRNITTRFW